MFLRNRSRLLVALTITLAACGTAPTEPRRSESPNRVAFDNLTARVSVTLSMPVEQVGSVSLVVDGTAVDLAPVERAEPEWANDSPEARRDADLLAATQFVVGEVAAQLPLLADRIDGPRQIEVRATEAEDQVLAMAELNAWGFCGSDEVAAQLVEEHRTFGGQFVEEGLWILQPVCAYCRYDDPSLDRETCY